MSTTTKDEVAGGVGSPTEWYRKTADVLLNGGENEQFEVTKELIDTYLRECINRGQYNYNCQEGIGYEIDESTIDGFAVGLDTWQLHSPTMSMGNQINIQLSASTVDHGELTMTLEPETPTTPDGTERTKLVDCVLTAGVTITKNRIDTDINVNVAIRAQ